MAATLAACALLLAGCGAGHGTSRGVTANGGTSPDATSSGTRSTAPAPATSRPPRSPTPVGRLGTYRPRRYELELRYRPAENAGWRALRVLALYPAVPPAAAAEAVRTGHGLFPLVVFAPGYRQCASSYRVLLRQWASAGYVVAAVQFPLTNCHLTAPDEADLVHQPADLSRVIGRMVAAGRRPGGRLSGLINPAKIALAGHSDGGDTVAATVANSCCIDHRVSAAIVLAGAEWPSMPGRYFGTRTVPMLFVQGTADSWNPQSASLQLYRSVTRGRRYYLALPGAGHFSPYEGGQPPEPIVVRVTVGFLDRYLAGQAAALAAMRRAALVLGAGRLVSGGREPRLAPAP